MVFSSMIFVFFFFALNIAAHNLCKSIKAKNAVMLISSLVFYSWAGLGFTAVLLTDVLIAWAAGLGIASSKGKRRAVFCGVGVALLLSVLCFFKYTGFFLDNISRIFGTETPEFVSSILLPIGISFYTFQLISYVADVYTRRVPAQRKFSVLLLYACLFHQCVAGPIVRYEDIEHDIMHRRVTLDGLSRGVGRFTVGLAKKVVIANSCAVIADTYFTGDAEVLSAMPAAGLWLSGFAFMLQIYFDFSAYSDMAIGMGLMCGFHYRENFDYPYISSSVTDFWRRWHISLSSFFRDYVYIPLGGSRCGRARQFRNLLVVWALTGFWHGASWNYVLWGMWYFVFLAVEKFAFGQERLSRIPSFLRRAFVLVVVYFGWIIFKFEDPHAMAAVLRGLFCGNGNAAFAYSVELCLRSNFVLLLVAVIGSTPVLPALKKRLCPLDSDGGENAGSLSRCALMLGSAVEVMYPAVLLIICAAFMTGDTYNPFLYFNF